MRFYHRCGISVCAGGIKLNMTIKVLDNSFIAVEKV